MTLRIVFMGTPEFSVPTLQALHNAGHDIVACYSQPPRPAGRRGLSLQPSPVHLEAERLGIEVRTPVSFKDEKDRSLFADLRADVAVVVAYGLLLPKTILETPIYGCLNGHASLLPRWRGAAPIHRAIMAGDAETGVMIMQMDEGLDTGPVGLTQKISTGPQKTTGILHDELSQITAELMAEAMTKIEANVFVTAPQSDEGIVYAKKIEKSETRIDWNQPAQKVQQMIMGLSPFPGAWCEMVLGGKAVRVKIHEAEYTDAEGPEPGCVLDDNLVIACTSGAIMPMKLQKAGAKPMTREEFIRGNPVSRGTVLS